MNKYKSRHFTRENRKTEMAKKQTSSLIGEMQTRSHGTPHRMANNKKTRSSNAGENGEAGEPSLPQYYKSASLKTCSTVSMKSNVHLPYKSAISLFCLCLKEINAFSYNYLYKSVQKSFIHNSWSLVQPRYPSIGEWINKSRYINAVEYHTVIRINYG